MKNILLLFLFFTSINAYAFVENTTKGYANCMACHVSPTGGGILTDYGRSLSQALMSTIQVSEAFSKPYYGLVHNKPNLLVGGQLRTIQVYGENNQVKVKRAFVMQNNFEVAAKYAEAYIVGTVGTREGPKGTPEKGKFLSERHFLLWETSPETRLRLGKFRQHFGLNHPNHTRLIKSELGFGSNSEAYNLDLTKFYEWGEINLSTSIGKLYDEPSEDNQNRNQVVNLTHYLGGKSRLSLSLLNGKSNTEKMQLIDTSIIAPITKKSYFRSEVAYKREKNIVNAEYSEATNSLFGEHQIGYQIYRGINPYLFFEHGQEDLSDHETLVTAPGVGIQLLPIAHVELQAEYQQKKFESDPENTDHRGFITFHLYH